MESNAQDPRPIAGVRLATVCAGIKHADRRDVVLLELAENATVAGVFTRNAFCAAPVQIARQHLSGQTPRYLLVNTGNANAGTGEAGRQAALACCHDVAQQGGCDPGQVLPFSTGVIGEALPVDKITAVVPQLLGQLAVDGWEDASWGILTTDNRPKLASTHIIVNGEEVSITGIAKGAGMIKPNMATMLAYIATDAVIAQDVLQALLAATVECSFNRITIDGDTSTNDACMLIASGASGVQLNADSGALQQFADALTGLMIELAQGLVRDGEGASKFVTVSVSGGATEQECLQVAYTVAESPLVKTALFASDPNWGRILAAIGRAGLEGLDVDLVTVHLGDVCIAEGGGRAASYTEQRGQAVMDGEEITISIDLARGAHKVDVWTTDLGYDYVKINAEYRT